MIFFYISLTLQELIRHWNDSLFICDILDDRNWVRKPVPCTKTESTEWIFDPFEGEIVIVRSPHDNAGVFDIHMSASVDFEVLIYPEHRGPNQQFSFINDTINGGTFIQNDLKCLEYVPATRSYRRNDCNGSDLQRFEILPNDYKYAVPEGPFTDAPGSVGSTSRGISSSFNTRPRFGRFRTSPRGGTTMIAPPTCACPTEVVRVPQPVVVTGGSKIIKSSSSSSMSSSGSSSSSSSGIPTPLRAF